MFIDLNRLIEQLCKDKGLDKSDVIKALERAILEVAKKHYGMHRDIEAHYNNTLGEIELFEFKTVVKEVEDPDLEISLQEAKKLDPDVMEGDSLGIKLDTAQLGRIGAQQAKFLVLEYIKQAEVDKLYEQYLEKKGTIITGVARHFEKNSIVVDIGSGVEAILPIRETIPGDMYKPGDRVSGYIYDVQKTSKGLLISLCRACNEFLIKLFEREVPEISDGIIEIKSVARDPGKRAKIAVFSSDQNIDPIGACVGLRGARVHNITKELRGEKIDIILYSSDPAKFIKQSLSPATIKTIILDQTKKKAEVVVPDSQLSLAIGKKGQNARLTAQLTGWGIDIISETRFNQVYESTIEALLKVDTMTRKEADILYQWGISSIKELSQLTPKMAESIADLDYERILELNEKAKKLIEKLQQEENVLADSSSDEDQDAKESNSMSWVGDGAKVNYRSEDEDIANIESFSFKTILKLNNAGYFSIRDLLYTDVKELARRTGFSEKQSKTIIDKAKEYAKS